MVILNHGRLYTINGARYSGEQIPGELDGWDALDLDPNALTEQTYDLLSQRSNTLYHTYAPVIGAVDKQADYAIGDGLFFRSMPDHETLGASGDWAREWGRRFQHLLHYEFTRLNFYQKMNTLFRGALSMGDSLLYFIREKEGFDMVEFSGFTIDSTAEFDSVDGGDSVHLGILHDKFYRRKGFVDRSGAITRYKDEKGRQNVVQFFIKKQPRQLRGWPLAYSIISLAKADSRHWGATLDAAILEGTFFAQTMTEKPQNARAALDDIVHRGKSKGIIRQALESIGNIRRVTPGNMMNFRTGEKMEFFDKKTPGGTFGLFKEKILDFIGMATGTPPEVIASKYSTAYTAHKGALNDFQKSYMQKRYSFIDSVCYAAMREVAVNMINEGIIDAPGFFDSEYRQRAYLSGVWLGPVPGYINPLQEIKARELAVKNGFENRADAMFNITGADYEDAVKEWHRQEALYAGTPEEQRAQTLLVELEGGGGNEN
jgi:capsid protein